MSVGTGAYSTPMKHDLATLVGSATQPCSRSCVKRANTDGDPFIRCSSACEKGKTAHLHHGRGAPGSCRSQVVTTRLSVTQIHAKSPDNGEKEA
jgi:hypothetical protein